jgi:hypothetical protein
VNARHEENPPHHAITDLSIFDLCLTAIAFTPFLFLYRLILRPATEAYHEQDDVNASQLTPSFHVHHLAGGSMSSVPASMRRRADRRLEKSNDDRRTRSARPRRTSVPGGVQPATHRLWPASAKAWFEITGCGDRDRSDFTKSKTETNLASR